MPIVRLPGGELRDEIRMPLYDTKQKGDANALTINTTETYFSDVMNQPRWRTNLRQNNLLETAVSYRVMGLALDAQYAARSAGLFPRALPLIMDYSSLRVRIGEKDYWEGATTYACGRLDQNAAIDAGGAGALNVVFQKAGAQAVQAVIWSGRHVVDINPLQSFAVFLTTDVPAAEVASCILNAGEFINLKFSFKGLMRRPVQ
jgi:hypothetical protein